MIDNGFTENNEKINDVIDLLGIVKNKRKKLFTMDIYGEK
jgi:hypothetical protein